MASRCPESRGTVKYITSCPRDRKTWDERAELKRCPDITNGTCNFGKHLKYHCLPNAYRNASIEVCAPPTNMPRGNTFSEVYITFLFLQMYHDNNKSSSILFTF